MERAPYRVSPDALPEVGVDFKYKGTDNVALAPPPDDKDSPDEDIYRSPPRGRNRSRALRSLVLEDDVSGHVHMPDGDSDDHVDVAMMDCVEYHPQATTMNQLIGYQEISLEKLKEKLDEEDHNNASLRAACRTAARSLGLKHAYYSDAEQRCIITNMTTGQQRGTRGACSEKGYYWHFDLDGDSLAVADAKIARMPVPNVGNTWDCTKGEYIALNEWQKNLPKVYIKFSEDYMGGGLGIHGSAGAGKTCAVLNLMTSTSVLNARQTIMVGPNMLKGGFFNEIITTLCSERLQREIQNKNQTVAQFKSLIDAQRFRTEADKQKAKKGGQVYNRATTFLNREYKIQLYDNASTTHAGFIQSLEHGTMELISKSKANPRGKLIIIDEVHNLFTPDLLQTVPNIGKFSDRRQLFGDKYTRREDVQLRRVDIIAAKLFENWELADKKKHAKLIWLSATPGMHGMDTYIYLLNILTPDPRERVRYSYGEDSSKELKQQNNRDLKHSEELKRKNNRDLKHLCHERLSYLQNRSRTKFAMKVYAGDQSVYIQPFHARMMQDEFTHAKDQALKAIPQSYYETRLFGHRDSTLVNPDALAMVHQDLHNHSEFEHQLALMKKKYKKLSAEKTHGKSKGDVYVHPRRPWRSFLVTELFASDDTMRQTKPMDFGQWQLMNKETIKAVDAMQRVLYDRMRVSVRKGIYFADWLVFMNGNRTDLLPWKTIVTLLTERRTQRSYPEYMRRMREFEHYVKQYTAYARHKRGGRRDTYRWNPKDSKRDFYKYNSMWMRMSPYESKYLETLNKKNDFRFLARVPALEVPPHKHMFHSYESFIARRSTNFIMTEDVETNSKWPKDWTRVANAWEMIQAHCPLIVRCARHIAGRTSKRHLILTYARNHKDKAVDSVLTRMKKVLVYIFKHIGLSAQLNADSIVTPTGQSKDNSIDTLFNDQDTSRVLILSREYWEGINVFNTHYVHVLDLPETIAALEQGLSRATRNCGSTRLPFEPGFGGIVKYLTYTLFTSGGGGTVDDYQTMMAITADNSKTTKKRRRGAVIGDVVANELAPKFAGDAQLLADFHQNQTARITDVRVRRRDVRNHTYLLDCKQGFELTVMQRYVDLIEGTKVDYFLSDERRQRDERRSGTIVSVYKNPHTFDIARDEKDDQQRLMVDKNIHAENVWLSDRRSRFIDDHIKTPVPYATNTIAEVFNVGGINDLVHKRDTMLGEIKKQLRVDQLPQLGDRKVTVQLKYHDVSRTMHEIIATYIAQQAWDATRMLDTPAYNYEIMQDDYEDKRIVVMKNQVPGATNMFREQKNDAQGADPASSRPALAAFVTTTHHGHEHWDVLVKAGGKYAYFVPTIMQTSRETLENLQHTLSVGGNVSLIMVHLPDKYALDLEQRHYGALAALLYADLCIRNNTILSGPDFTRALDQFKEKAGIERLLARFVSSYTLDN